MKWKTDTIVVFLFILFCSILLTTGLIIDKIELRKAERATENIPEQALTYFPPGEGQAPPVTTDKQTDSKECPTPLRSLSLTPLYVDFQTGALYVVIDGESKQIVITDTRNLEIRFLEDLL